MRRVIPFLLIGFATLVLAQDGPLTNGANIPVRTDANGYLIAAAQTYSGPDGPRRVFANTLVRTDANGYLIITNPTGLGVSIGGTVTSGTTGSVLFVGAGPVLAQDNSEFFWDATNDRLGIGTATPSHTVDILNATLASGQNIFRATGTLSSTAATQQGVVLDLTTAGSGAQRQIGLNTTLRAGYTGVSSTYGFSITNQAESTGSQPFNNDQGASDFSGGNIGVRAIAQGTTTGANTGLFGQASGGNSNFGVWGEATVAKNSATNIGVIGWGLNTGTSPVQVGGFFTLANLIGIALPTFESAALIADNAATTSPVFIARDNGSAVFTIADGGAVTLTTPLAVGSGGTGMTTLTTNGVLFGNGTSAVQVTAQGAANSVLTANAGAPSFSATPTVTSLTATGAGSLVALATPPRVISSVQFEAAARFAENFANSGTATFNSQGLVLATGATGTSYDRIRWEATSNAILTTVPSEMGASLSIQTLGTDLQAYVGLGGITASGTAITFTSNHIGFKIVRAASGTASLFATQADGSTETASSALTTVIQGDNLDLAVRVTSASSVSYWYRLNGSAWSSATTLTTNIPTAAGNNMSMAVSNATVATNSELVFQVAHYVR